MNLPSERSTKERRTADELSLVWRVPIMRRPASREEGEAAASQHKNQSRTSKLPSERLVLLVLGSLLAAALVVICRLSTHIVEIKANLQSLTEENKVLRRELTGPEEEAFCEDGWVRFDGTCYYFSTIRLSWEQSSNSCREAGAELVTVDTREEQYFLRSVLNRKMKSFNDMFWIGLTDSLEEGRWVWVDGSDLDESLQFWSQREPDNWTEENPAGEDCVRMGMEGGGAPMKNWYDNDCASAQKRVCEKNPEARERKKTQIKKENTKILVKSLTKIFVSSNLDNTGWKYSDTAA